MHGQLILVLPIAAPPESLLDPLVGLGYVADYGTSYVNFRASGKISKVPRHRTNTVDGPLYAINLVELYYGLASRFIFL